MTNTPDLAALKAAHEKAEAEYTEASVAKSRAVALASEKWKVAAASFARYSKAKAKMELDQMRARGTVSAEAGDESA